MNDFFQVTSPEQVTAAFQTQLRELNESPLELANRMQKLGDYRPYETILRGIQRMLSGEIRVSGEMKVIVTMMLRQQYRLKRKYDNLDWKSQPDGSYFTKADDFFVTLVPKTRGRWLVNVMHKEGYNHPWPRWQDSLEAAKLKALVTIEDATDFLIEQEVINLKIAFGAETE